MSSRGEISVNIVSLHPYNFQAGPNPPSYDEVTNTNPNVPPPEYQSVIAAQNASSQRQSDDSSDEYGPEKCLSTALVLLIGMFGCITILGITIAIPVSMIVMGSLYFNDCPQQMYIPIYLIVAGTLGLIQQTLRFYNQVATDENEDEIENQNPRISFIQLCLNVFMFGWFIAGSVWVYREYEPNYNPDMAPNYCNKTLYTFAYWLNTLAYIIIGTFILLSGIVGCCILRKKIRLQTE